MSQAQAMTGAPPKGHPRGLKALFFTEMWERLGFYLMLGILFLYIIDTERGGLGLSNATAGEIYGTYLAFVYFTPFLGGMIADRYFGYRRSVALGGLLMAINMVFAIFLAHSGEIFSTTQHGGWAIELQMFYLMSSLAVVFLGSGRLAFKQD